MARALVTKRLEIVVSRSGVGFRPPVLEVDIGREALELAVDWSANEDFWGSLELSDFHDLDGKLVVEAPQRFAAGEIEPRIVPLEIELGRGRSAWVKYSVCLRVAKPVEGFPSTIVVDPILLLKRGHD